MYRNTVLRVLAIVPRLANLSLHYLTVPMQSILLCLREGAGTADVITGLLQVEGFLF